MKKKDIILNLSEQIKELIYEAMEHESEYNEPILKIYYKNIMELLIEIQKERLMYLNFWSEE